VGGKVRSLGADAKFAELSEADVLLVGELARDAGFGHIPAEDVTKIVSGKQLYHFDALKDQKY